MAEPRPSRLAPYRAVLASRLRTQRAYPLSFATDLLSAFLIGLLEFAEMWVIFSNVPQLGGLDLDGMLLLYGLSNTSFAVADMLVGHADTLPTYIRLGRLDAFYLRPQPLLLQLMTSDIALRRVARIAVAATVLGLGVMRNDIDWTASHLALFGITLLSGIAIFAGLFICAAGVQFFLIDGSELTNAFTYGGSYASMQPTSVFPTPMKLIFGFLVPVAFTSYLPAIALLGIPGPALLPGWLAWGSPLAALWVWAAALFSWRVGTRHYQGGGG
ncbi:ABC transporter permease [Nocardia huaxiensis]|uniref:ABC-2 family transporter protein n=1 Tax=Nocardia huaxiensis TaxID=2755382 RepID=A0A7D6VII5_9NOCA|nr:ABC-2 family transporter protein [Nocardia huaxiensis]QLY30350.1 ABC-2 family transporter protein [Nocardia huaxiensis]UFS96014.1 ABC-2 family transporter protein [Nocardia huaxiensis]